MSGPVIGLQTGDAISPSNTSVLTATMETVLSTWDSGSARLTLPDMVSVYSPANSEVVNLQNGFNAISARKRASGVILLPPAGNAVAYFLVNAPGETGFRMHLTAPQVICFGGGVQNISLQASAPINNFSLFWF